MQAHVARNIARYTRIFLAAALLAGGALLLLHHARASAAVQTVVTVEFDDGNADQYQALAMLKFNQDWVILRIHPFLFFR